jgi:hypothetical protein
MGIRTDSRIRLIRKDLGAIAGELSPTTIPEPPGTNTVIVEVLRRVLDGMKYQDNRVSLRTELSKREFETLRKAFRSYRAGAGAGTPGVYGGFILDLESGGDFPGGAVEVWEDDGGSIIIDLFPQRPSTSTQGKLGDMVIGVLRKKTEISLEAMTESRDYGLELVNSLYHCLEEIFTR